MPETKRRKSLRIWLWLIPLALLWSGIHLLVWLIRFGSLPPPGEFNFLVFTPMSLVSGVVFLGLWMWIGKRPHRTGLILGYLIASPFALIGSLLSGLVYTPIIGTLLWGAIPLVIGMVVGTLAGTILAKVGAAGR